MGHTPKLETFVFKLKSQNDAIETFKEFFTEKFGNGSYNASTPESEIFMDYFKNFIETIDSTDFYKDENKKKAFTAYDTAPTGTQNPSIQFNTDQYLVYGKIEGGHFGQDRNRSTLGNKQTKQPLTKVDVIMDKFHFLIYTPLTSGKGVLMIQSFSSSSVSDIFLKFIKDFFTLQNRYKPAKVVKHIPANLVRNFIDRGVISEITLSDEVLLDQLTDEVTHETVRTGIKIKIQATAIEPVPKGFLSNLLSKLGTNASILGKQVDRFRRKSAKMVNTSTNKTSKFDIVEESGEYDIKPVHYLDNENIFNADGTINYNLLHSYCLTLLEEIKPNIYPEDYVEER